MRESPLLSKDAHETEAAPTASSPKEVIRRILFADDPHLPLLKAFFQGIGNWPGWGSFSALFILPCGQAV
jgi:hypothetical protein